MALASVNFKEGNTNLYQILVHKKGKNLMPWTREHMFS